MVAALVKNVSMVYALLVGLICFIAVGMHRGFRLQNLLVMSASGIKKSLIVIEVMCIIGFITAIWRVSGTITIFVYYGMRIITPSLFILIAFTLSCVLSYALWTSFGVAGTVGVIFMTLAGITETKIFENVKIMMRTGMLPLIITFVIYAVLSFQNPISLVDEALLRQFEESFNLSL